MTATPSAPTAARMWRDRVRATPSAEAYRHRVGEDWVSMTWRQADERVRRIAGGLLAHGVQPGERIAILCGTRVEWVLVQQAILSVGAAVTTIYPSSTPEDCAHVLVDSGATGIFVEDDAQLAKVEGSGWTGQNSASSDSVLRIWIVADGPGRAGVAPLRALEDAGATWLDQHPDAVDARIDAVGPEDLATLIYTSGTTGRPKGVMLVHDNWVFQAELARHTLGADIRDGDLLYLFLPLAHSFGLACAFGAIHLGVPSAIDGDVDRIRDGLLATRPTAMPAVPRVFEKIHHRILSRAEHAGPRALRVFRWASRVGEEVVRTREAGGRIGPWLGLRHALADRLVFRRLRDALGGRMRMFASGGAPLADELGRFFQAAGLTVVEGYGLTETSAGAVANDPHDVRFGTVGRPAPGVELKIAEDGEILLRGRNVMRGYWNNPAATAEALDPDGFLRTGDLGRVGPDGRLTVTGRKKDLIITSGGKNIAPSEIENKVKAACGLVSEIVMVGDRRPYCIALVWLEADAVRDAGVGPAEARDRVWAAVEAVNAGLPSYATIKRIAIVDDPLTPESGLLTPSMKVKRGVVAERYADRVAATYGT